MWIMYTAIKHPTDVSAWGEAELERSATLLLQGGLDTQGSALVDIGKLRAGGTNLAFGSSSCSHRGVTRGLAVARPGFPGCVP